MQTKEKVSRIIEEIEDKNVVAVSHENESDKGEGSKHMFDDLILGANLISGEDSALRVELGEANAHIDTTLERQFGGNKLSAGIKRFIWKILAKINRPMFAEQNIMNHHLVASLNELNRMRGEHEAEIVNLRNAVMKLNIQNTYLSKKNAELQNAMEEAGISCGGGMSDFEYESFEAYFRGDEETIKDKLSVYVPYFKEQDAPVLEIGSGRGEFLELLRENGIKASGIDMFKPFVNKCLRKDLDVQYGNGITLMKTIPGDTLGGVFAAQVVEHISNDDVITLYRESYRVLKEGGYCIFETQNPCCVSIFTNAFYIDPSHKKPIHPYYLEYIARLVGFTDVKIAFAEKSRADGNIPQIKSDAIENLDEINEAISKLSEKMYGCQDYAIIARK